MQWDREKIFDLFVYQTRKEILAIPLSMTASQDKLIWKENSAKLFTVKSAYQVALKLKEKKLAEHSRAVTDRALWKKKIWTLKTPPKFSNSSATMHMCCEIGRGNWLLGRVLKIMYNNGSFFEPCYNMLEAVLSLAMMKLCTCAVILEGAMENH
uniref:Uncharacterized protein n=1 Tax=Quercus lobata TaxID=97700 RepID=A0A7N2MS02_QUELO